MKIKYVRLIVLPLLLLAVFFVGSCQNNSDENKDVVDEYIVVNHVENGFYIPKINGYTAKKLDVESSIQVPVIAVFNNNDIDFNVKSVYLANDFEKYQCMVDMIMGYRGGNYGLVTMILSPEGLTEGSHELTTLIVTIDEEEFVYNIGSWNFDVKKDAIIIGDESEVELQGTTTSMYSIAPYYSMQIINKSNSNFDIDSINFGGIDKMSKYIITSADSENENYIKNNTIPSGKHKYFKIKFEDGEDTNNEFLNVTPFINLSNEDGERIRYIPFEARYWPEMTDERIIEIIKDSREATNFFKKQK